MHRVLLIEDEPGIADSVIYALKTEGIAVDWHDTIQAGLQAFRKQAPDLVILDVGLPDGSGFDCCLEMRRHSALPIIFLTARSEEVDRVLGLEIGADDYISKPFSPRELSARVRARLRRLPGGPLPEAAPPSDINGETAVAEQTAFAIDERRCLISYQQQSLALSAQQYRLLRALILQPGRVFSRDALLQAAEADPELCEPRTVDSHIRDLRAVLRPLGADSAIITHRGLGYSIREQQ